MIRHLRIVLLLVLIASVVTVVALILRGRALQEPTAPPEEIAAGELDKAEGMITVGEGFERTVSEGERSLFTVRGDRFAVDRDQKVYLEGVAITIDSDDDATYELTAPEGVFDPEKREAQLSGGIELMGPEGFFLQTQGLQVIQRGRQMLSTSDVYFRFGERFHGRADRLRVLLRARRYHLIGHARIETLEGAADPFRLTTRLLTIDRSRHLIEGDDGPVELIRGKDWLSAIKMVVFLDDEDQAIQYLRARERVVAELRSDQALGQVNQSVPLEALEEVTEAGSEPEGTNEPAEPDAPEEDVSVDDEPGLADDEAAPSDRIGRIRVHTESLDLEFAGETNQPKEIYLEGGPSQGRAVLRSFVVHRGPIHRLRAPRIHGVFEDGLPKRFEAEENVDLVLIERPPLSISEEMAEEAADTGTAGSEGKETTLRSVSRTAKGRRAEATFDETGQLAAVTLIDRVTVVDSGTRARGDTGVFQAADDSATLTGSPATLVSERGEMEAPTLVYSRGDGILHGTGGVRARLADAEQTSLAGSPLAQGDEPVWVEAEEGFFREAPRSFLFKGAVRAWRGENLLTAEQLRGDDAEQRLHAAGDVRSLWIPEQAPEEALDEAATAPAGAEEPAAPAPAAGDDAIRQGGPIEVTADEMVYLQGSRLLDYSGHVVAEQEKRVLACQEMELLMAPEGSEGGMLEQMVCTGNVRITDPGSDEGRGRTLQGHRAVYDPAQRIVDVTAGPKGQVTMKDGEGNVLEGPRMVFEIDADRVRVLAREEGDGTPAAEEGAEAEEEEGAEAEVVQEGAEAPPGSPPGEGDGAPDTERAPEGEGRRR